MPPRLWNIIGVLIIAAYQHSLTYDGLRDYIINGIDGRGGRHGLIDSNREGLTSSVGFLCVYIMGIQLGNIVMKQRYCKNVLADSFEYKAPNSVLNFDLYKESVCMF